MISSFIIDNPIFIQQPENIQNSDLVNQAVFEQTISNYQNSSNTAKVNLSSQSCKDIYVCTFCQVFSPYLNVVSEHIDAKHGNLLLSGTTAEDFVSKLQALEGNGKRSKGKVGRPKKKKEEHKSEVLAEKIFSVEPVIGPDGLFWCKNCLRSFRKPRQLTQHICLLSEEQGTLSSDDTLEEFEGDEFKPYDAIDPEPWSQRKMRGSSKFKLKSESVNEQQDLENDTSTTDCSTISKITPNWRQDPSYVPLFHTESEKAAFEEHLRLIDYSSVDTLFQIERKKLRNYNKQNDSSNNIYSCKCCKKVLRTLSQVRLHCLTHTDFKPFQCPQCEYCTNSKGSLYTHMRKHTGNVFCCSFCDFSSAKRAHLLDHEATHSSVPQFCKLCKNVYKTLRSLKAHVQKYHNNAGGKKYLKSLSSKDTKELKCGICKKKFKSNDMLQIHNRLCHEESQATNNTLESHPENNLDNVPILEDISQSKDPLAELVLNDLLEQEKSQSILYNGVFSNTNESATEDVLMKFQEKISRLSPNASILEECQKTLNFDILNECLQNRNFQNTHQEFSLNSETLQNNPTIGSAHHLQVIPEEGNLSAIAEDKSDEAEPVEIKLFEKCQRAPAYVCCVCSRIYICPTTLKAHLKEHINSTNAPLIVQPDEEFESSKMAEDTTELDKVCEILQNSSDTCSFDEELENLYSSSLDMIWYLPEVSVVLEKDPTLCDILLDEITSFSTSADGSPNMGTKGENVLECFDEL